RLAVLGGVRSTMTGPVLSKIWTENTNIGLDWSLMAVSPDGRYLLEAKSGLLIHDLSLKKDRYLRALPSPSDRWIAYPIFAPDGERVVYVTGTKDGLREIRTIKIDGTNEQTVFNGSEYRKVELHAISPDGKLAAVGLVRADSDRSASGGSFWQVGLVSLQTG